MFQFLKISTLLSAFVCLVACGSSAVTDGAEQAEENTTPESLPPGTQLSDAPPIPDGVYEIRGPLCETTGRTPLYDGLHEPVEWHDFNFLTLRTKTIIGDRWYEIYEDPDCRLVITGGIALNEQGIYQETKERSHFWKPERCSFTASYTPPELTTG